MFLAPPQNGGVKSLGLINGDGHHSSIATSHIQLSWLSFYFRIYFFKESQKYFPSQLLKL